MGMRYGMMEPIASDMDAAGYAAIEVIANTIIFKKIVRDLKEDPWQTLRMLSSKMPNTLKTGMGLVGFNAPIPPVVARLGMQMTADIVIPYRVQTVCNTADQLERLFPTYMPTMRDMGFQSNIGISYSISPRHTDELFAEKVRGAVAFKPDAIYLKDQGGLLTVDRIRTLVPIMLEAAGDIQVELHSHCTTGLAPSVYSEAMRLGIKVLHCGIPPASDGSAQPSVLDTARNARELGFTPLIDERLLESVSRRLRSVTIQEGLPLGEPMRYDEAQFAHQIPGGVISNLRFQLAAINMEHHLEEVKAESIRIRAELGYPAMITPYSQYVVTQASIHVLTGERYKVVTDELIRFAQGAGGVDSGYTWMDQDLKDRFLSLPRAKELADQAAEQAAFTWEEMTLHQAKERYGSIQMSDEELVLRAIMGGNAEVDAMRRAGPPRRYLTDETPLLSLISELDQHRRIRYVNIQRGGDSLHLENRTPVAGTAPAS
jgi:oxaloacetate decarboxylase alpha subunit